MPYIKQELRHKFNNIESLSISSPGELNYCITRLCVRFINTSDSSTSYQTINDIMGALSSAQMEFYRRMAGPYEEKKLDQNGDAYLPF